MASGEKRGEEERGASDGGRPLAQRVDSRPGPRAQRGAGPHEENCDGVCLLCGKSGRGTPAGQDAVILAARKIRSLLHLPAKHTVACPNCLPECEKRRAAFEKRLGGYRLGAILFFLLMAGGFLLLGRLDVSAVAGGLLGGALVYLLAYTAYCPKFGISDGKTP